MFTFRQRLAALIDNSFDPDVMVEQVGALTKQVPLLYLIGNANAFALSYTHFGIAPLYLTAYLPCVMLACCLMRVAKWRKTRNDLLTVAMARSRLRQLMAMTAVLGSVYAIWSLCLYPYGDVYTKSHVAFFMATTMLGTISCLMHLREAALLLMLAVLIPFMVRFTTTGHPAFTAMAIDFLVITMAMVFILLRYSSDFRSLILSQKRLAALSSENQRIANVDSLTDLPNRRSFFQSLDAITTACEGGACHFALGFIDLDDFKPVNDVYGHGAGDKVLIEVGRRLRSALGTEVLVARLGGDEFGLIVRGQNSHDALIKIGTRICDAIMVPIDLAMGVARVGASVGFGVFDGGTSQHSVLDKADYALYEAKARKCGAVVVFSPRHAADLRRESQLTHTLRRADMQAEFRLDFQPILEVHGGRILAYEALARWTSPVMGEVPPTIFIELAERVGLINRLTEVLFGKALAAARTWPETIGLSFNLSAHDIGTPALIETLRSMISSSGLAPSRITFEITETALVQDFDMALAVMRSLKSIGVSMALDDFGTGYSSLSYVHRLPLDKIKVDRSFVADVTVNQASRDILKTVIDLCRNLMIPCVVEGVETYEQVLVLRALGCTTMQGYYFGRPRSTILAHQDHPKNVAAACA